MTQLRGLDRATGELHVRDPRGQPFFQAAQADGGHFEDLFITANKVFKTLLVFAVILI